jgi:ABC-type sugar transport system substrate-binding protein
MVRRVSVIVAIGAAVVAIAACGSSSSSSSTSASSNSGAASSSGKPKTVAVTIYGHGVSPWLDSYGARLTGLIPTLKSQGINLVVDWANSTGSGQDAQVTSLMALSPKVIGVMSIDAQASVATFRRIKQAGITAAQLVINPVPAAQPYLAAYIGGANDIAQGSEMGEWLKTSSICAGGCNVAIIRGATGGSDNPDRANGFIAAVKGTPVKVVADVSSDWSDQQTIQNAVSAVLKTHSDVNVLYTEYDLISIGAYKVLQQMGLTHKVKIVNVVGGSCAAEPLLRSGAIAAVTWEDPWLAAENTATQLTDLANGQKLPFNNYIATPIVTSATVDHRPCHD